MRFPVLPDVFVGYQVWLRMHLKYTCRRKGKGCRCPLVLDGKRGRCRYTMTPPMTQSYMYLKNAYVFDEPHLEGRVGGVHSFPTSPQSAFKALHKI